MAALKIISTPRVELEWRLNAKISASLFETGGHGIPSAQLRVVFNHPNRTIYIHILIIYVYIYMCICMHIHICIHIYIYV